MGTKSRLLKANLYEDYDLLEQDEYIAPIIKEKHINKHSKKRNTNERKIVKKQNKTYFNKNELNISENSFSVPISDKLVECYCNKCNTEVLGIIVSCIYNPFANLEAPFVIYECKACGHSGRRSVFAKALPPEEFEKKYL